MALLVSQHFHHYAPAIMRLPSGRPLAKDELLVDDYLLRREGKVEIYYSPHNEHLNREAKVVIVGITPGWTQMERAFRQARLYLSQGLTTEEICRRVKAEARFAGAMRANLTAMLNSLGLHRHIGLSDCGELFGEAGGLLHTTSMLRYPVFVEQRNYTGHGPPLLRTEFLRESAMEFLREELCLLRYPLIVPLGKTVEDILRRLAGEGILEVRQCLWGFPHPSGANGHRHKQFAEAADVMKEILARFFGRSGM